MGFWRFHTTAADTITDTVFYTNAQDTAFELNILIPNNS